MASKDVVIRAALTHHVRTEGDPDGELRRLGQLLELDMALSPADRLALSDVLSHAAEGRCVPSTLAAQLYDIACDLASE